jgi:glycosyltransferase involved in cell wall biosynthesis
MVLADIKNTTTGAEEHRGAGWNPAGSQQRSRGTPTARVALVHLGRPSGLGTTRRFEVWRQLLEAAGLDVIEVDLLRDHHRRVPMPLTALPALRGQVVPESAVWSARAAETALRALDPDAVVFITPRAFHPRLVRIARVSVLDFQDLFSASYRGRATVDARRSARAGWRLLACATQRFESRDHGVQVVTAGWSEARDLDAVWIPNTVTVVPRLSIDDHEAASYDVLFFGMLASLPNVDALRTLSGLWPQLVSKRPSATCLIAGSSLSDEVRHVAGRHGWQLEEDFDDVDTLCQQARVGVVPLRYANGIQNKVLEAAAAGLPQVVSPQALRGTAPGFPAIAARNPAETVDALGALLSDPVRRVELGSLARAHVLEHYSVERWAPKVLELVAG